MKPLWTHTLAWIAAVLAAVLLALSLPELLNLSPFHAEFPQGAIVPRKRRSARFARADS